jgi:hypothetical protein
MIKFIRFIKNLLLGTTILKMFPSLSYKGVVNTQIRIYKKLKRKGYSETVALNKILDSRRRLSLRDLGADAFYQELISIDNKTLEQVIQAIVEWEYLDSFEARVRRGKNNVPFDFVEEYRKEMKIYISKKIEAL